MEMVAGDGFGFRRANPGIASGRAGSNNRTVVNRLRVGHEGTVGGGRDGRTPGRIGKRAH